MNIPNNFNYTEWLINNTTNLESIAVIDSNKETTYRELFDKSKSVASALRAKGLVREQRIAIVLYDSVDSVCLILGAIYAGMVPVVLDPRSPIKTINYCLKHSGASVVFVENEVEGIELENTIPSSRVYELYNFDTNCLPADTHKDEPCVFIYTSGTTGHPKAVVHSHAMPYIVGQITGKESLGIISSDKIFATAKLFFSFGLYGLWNAFGSGASVIVNPKVNMPNVLAGLINQHKPTVMISVPVIYGMLLSKEIDNKFRFCQSGGDKLTEAIATKWQEKFGVRLTNSWGTTEMCSAALFNHNGINLTSLGKTAPGFEIEIRDTNGNLVPTGSIGELFVKAPSAGLMYWHDKQWSAKTFNEWMPTGDMCSQDKDGYITFFGRAGDVFKVNGKFFDVTSIEESFLAYPGITDAAVVGVQDNNGRTKLSAYIVAEKSVEITDVKTHVLKKHTAAECPREISIVQQLPRTSTGKIQRYLLKESA